jgi:hypothetical protein
VRRLRVLVLVTGFGMGFAATSPGAGERVEQHVTPLTPPAEQRIEVLHPAGEQHVQALDGQGVQEITGDATDSVATRGAKVVGKVVLTVVGAAVAVGGMLAALLFI